jgi:hypothetical protein
VGIGLGSWAKKNELVKVFLSLGGLIESFLDKSRSQSDSLPID